MILQLHVLLICTISALVVAGNHIRLARQADKCECDKKNPSSECDALIHEVQQFAMKYIIEPFYSSQARVKKSLKELLPKYILNNPELLADFKEPFSQQPVNCDKEIDSASLRTTCALIIRDIKKVIAGDPYLDSLKKIRLVYHALKVYVEIYEEFGFVPRKNQFVPVSQTKWEFGSSEGNVYISFEDRISSIEKFFHDIFPGLLEVNFVPDHFGFTESRLKNLELSDMDLSKNSTEYGNTLDCTRKQLYALYSNVYVLHNGVKNPTKFKPFKTNYMLLRL